MILPTGMAMGMLGISGQWPVVSGQKIRSTRATAHDEQTMRQIRSERRRRQAELEGISRLVRDERGDRRRTMRHDGYRLATRALAQPHGGQDALEVRAELPREPLRQ